MTSTPVAGWYPDPLHRHERRYWDGSAWTAHVADGQTVGQDPLVAARADARPGTAPAWGAPSAPAHTGASEAGWKPDPLGHAEHRWWDGHAWTTHVATGGTPFEDALDGTGTPQRPRRVRPPRPARPAPSRNGLIAAAAVVALVLGTGVYVGTQLGDDGDGGGGGGGPTATDVLGAGEPAPGLSGYLDLGESGAPVGETVGPDGATIETPDGVTIEVPEDAHAGDVAYTVTATEIVGQSYGELVDPASKLITVDNGGLVAAEPITVTIPADVDDDQFAMAMFYDSTTGGLEPLPLVSIDDGEVVALTRHFSAIFVSVVDIALLTSGTIDSGFRPGVDSWQFVNFGSYAAPGGHCSGQSLSALWYYTEQRVAVGAPSLYGRFDDRIDAVTMPATAGLQWDDDDGYRLASAVQHDEVAAYDTLERTEDALTKARVDAYQYYAFAYSILLTGEPQYVGLYASAGGGHAMIVYGVTEDALLIADPNYPAEYREISWDAGAEVLGPYEARANAAEPPQPYEMIGYYAKSALVDWTGLGGRWQEFVDGTVGDGLFPSGTLEVREEDEDGDEVWVPLVDGYEVDDDTESITVRLVAPNFNDRLRVYRWDTELVLGPWDAAVTVPLEEGVNRLGFETLGWVWAKSATSWVAFDRLDVVRGEPDEAPLDLIFVIDLTSSMEDDIAGVKAAATKIVQTISATSEDWRVAIVGYRDVGDSPMFEDYPFSDDEDEVIANINALSVSGGGDTPEAVYEALSRAIDSSTVGGWRDGEPNKQMILMGDAPPHVPGSGGETAASVAREAELADPVVVQSVVVGNTGMIDAEAQATFAEISRLTFGQTFTAEDATAVPAALQQSIGAAGLAPAATSDDGGRDWPRAILLIVSLLLVIGGAGVLVWRLLRPAPGAPGQRRSLGGGRAALAALVLVAGLAGVVWWGTTGDADGSAGPGDPFAGIEEPDDREGDEDDEVEPAGSTP